MTVLLASLALASPVGPAGTAQCTPPARPWRLPARAEHGQDEPGPNRPGRDNADSFTRSEKGRQKRPTAKPTRSDCITILGYIRQVIPPDGRLLVIETVVPAGNEPSPSKLFDMVMMAFPDGMERSESQFRAIFDASGFHLTGITPTASPVSIIEARPV